MYKGVFKNIKILLLLSVIVFITILISIHPDIKPYLTKPEKTDTTQIVKEFTKEIETFLGDLPKKQKPVLRSTISFNTFSLKKIFIGDSIYDYQNSVNNSYKKFSENRLQSGNTIFEKIIKQYNISIEPAYSEILNDETKKTTTDTICYILNASVKRTRLDEILNVAKITPKNIFLSLIYNHIVDGNDMSVLTTIEDGKLKSYNRNDLLFDLINDSILKVFRNNIESDTLQKRYKYLFEQPDSPINFKDLGISSDIIYKQFKPTYLYYNYRDEDLYYKKDTKIDYDNYGKVSKPDQIIKMNNFLIEQFGLEDATLKKTINNLTDDEKQLINSCFNNTFNWSGKSSTTESITENLRSYIYNQNTNPYAFLIYENKLYTLNEFLNLKNQLGFTALILDWDSINGNLNSIYTKYRLKLNPGISKISVQDSTILDHDIIIYLFLGIIDLLLIVILLFKVYNLYKLNENIRRLKQIGEFIHNTKDNTVDEKSPSDIDSNNPDYALSHLKGIIDFLIKEEHSQPFFSLPIKRKVWETKRLKDDKFKLKKGRFRTYTLKDSEAGKKYMVFDNIIEAKDGSKALKINNNTYLINKYGIVNEIKFEKYGQLYRFNDIKYIKSTYNRWAFYYKEDRVETIPDIIDNDELMLNNYALSKFCKKRKIDFPKKLLIDQGIRYRKIIIDYTELFEQIYFEASNIKKDTQTDGDQYRKIIDNTINYIEADRSVTDLENRISQDSKITINKIKSNNYHFNKIGIIINKARDINSIDKRLIELLDYLNDNLIKDSTGHIEIRENGGLDPRTYNSIVNSIIKYVSSEKNSDDSKTDLDSRIYDNLKNEIGAIKTRNNHLLHIKGIINNDNNSVGKQKVLFEYLNSKLATDQNVYLKNPFVELIDLIENNKTHLNDEEKLKKIIEYYEGAKNLHKETSGKNNLYEVLNLFIEQKNAFITIYKSVFKNFTNTNNTQSNIQDKINAANEFNTEINNIKKDSFKNLDFFSSLKKLIEFVIKITKNDNSLILERINKLEKYENKIEESIKGIKYINIDEIKTATGLESNFKNIMQAVKTHNELVDINKTNSSHNLSINLNVLKEYLADSLLSISFLKLLINSDNPKPLKSFEDNIAIIQIDIFGIDKILGGTKSKEEFKKIREDYRRFYKLWENNEEQKKQYEGIDIDESLEIFTNLKDKFETNDYDIEKLLKHHNFLINYIKLIDDKYVANFQSKIFKAKDLKTFSDFKSFIDNDENRELLNHLFEFMLHSYYFVLNALIPDKESMNNFRLLKNDFKIDDELFYSINKGFRYSWLEDSNTFSNNLFELSKILDLKELKVFISNYIIMPWDDKSEEINKRK